MSADIAKCEFTVSPQSAFEIPLSDGYVLYSAILNRVDDVNSEASDLLHSSDGHMNLTGLQGEFDWSTDRGRKGVRPDREYSMAVCIATNEDDEVNGILESLVFGTGSMRVGDGHFDVVESSFETTTTDDILAEADSYDRPEIDVTFNTPTCILAGDQGSTEMFPHRAAVFRSVAGSWNHIAPEMAQLDIDTDAVREYVYELPDLDSLRTHNVVVNVIGDDERRPIKRHGFTGECTYRLHDETSSALKNGVVTLALASEYLGVGSSVARGCGSVEVEVRER